MNKRELDRLIKLYEDGAVRGVILISIISKYIKNLDSSYKCVTDIEEFLNATQGGLKKVN